MNHLINTPNYEPVLFQDIEIDWPRLIARRPITLKHSNDLPKYLLLPEVQTLLACTLDARDHLIINTLWHTGIRPSELIALRPCDFYIDSDDSSFISIQSLKKRPGRRKKKQRPPARRMVPITDFEYLLELKRYITTNRIKSDDQLFTFTRQNVDLRLRKAVQDAEKNGVTFDIVVSAKTFRHSFAVNAILHFRPLKTLQGWLGHEDIRTTEIYTKVLAGDTAHEMQQVKFR